MRHGLMCALGVVWLGAAAVAQAVVGDVVAGDAAVRGSVVLAAGGTRVLSGSTISAGPGTALLRLARGGEVRVCANAALIAATAPNGRDLALGFSTGALEMHYALGPSSDSLQLPDFRLALVGPATFNLAVAADAKGDVCVRPMAGNTGSIIVHEQMGDGVYQVKPNEFVIFRNGKVVDRARELVGECGCPPPVQPVQMAEAPRTAAPAPARSGVAAAPSANSALAANAAQTQVTVDTPIVFRAEDVAAARAAAAANPELLARLNGPPTHDMLATVSSVARFHVALAPMVVPVKKSFGERLRGFFGRMFSGK